MAAQVPEEHRAEQRHTHRAAELLRRAEQPRRPAGRLDREGLAALSMRKLADELGTGAASLYWHVGSKDGLLDLVMDQIIGEGKVPDPDPDRWREQLKQVARDQRAASLRHPWLVRVSIGRIPMGPNALRYSERILAILRAGGLPPRLAVQGYLLLIAAVNGFIIDETGVDDSADPAASAPLTDRESRQEAADMARDYIASLPRRTVPQHDRPSQRVRRLVGLRPAPAPGRPERPAVTADPFQRPADVGRSHDPG